MVQFLSTLQLIKHNYFYTIINNGTKSMFKQT